MRNLFVQPKYTIDTSSLLAMMNSGEKYDKEVFKKLWNDFLVLCADGKVISHIEVHKEIIGGGIKNQIAWVKSYKQIFQDYNLPDEANVIREIGSKGRDFEFFLQQRKTKSVHADPWLVAQAKVENLILINEESVDSPKRIPQVSNAMGVRSINILGLIQEEGWSY